MVKQVIVDMFEKRKGKLTVQKLCAILEIPRATVGRRNPKGFIAFNH